MQPKDLYGSQCANHKKNWLCSRSVLTRECLRNPKDFWESVLEQLLGQMNKSVSFTKVLTQSLDNWFQVGEFYAYVSVAWS